MTEDGRLRTQLLGWYDAHARDLPWRRDPSPYGTLVSEVMLQQTRVEAVIPYYTRWMERFPDVHTLADADEHDVLRAWEGLGYYSRARNLHGAARVVRERFAGELPGDCAALRELPGVGDYTAGAVASIAFGRVEPAVDGNVRRVLARVFDLEAPGAAELRARAATLVDPDRPGDFNQALMELGATVCTPRSPACNDCPIRTHCLARARGTVALRPAPRKRATVPSFDLVSVVLIDRVGRVLLRRRPDTGLLAGMWEFPSVDMRPDDEAADQALALAGVLLGRAMDDEPPRPLESVAHGFSHRRETYHPFVIALARPGRGPALAERCAWVTRAGLREHAMPRAQRRIQAAAFAPSGASIAHASRNPQRRGGPMPKDRPEPETRNDDPNVQERQEKKARGERDQAEGDRVQPNTEDERINPEVGPRGDRKHEARAPRQPGGGRKGMPR